jgi:hypothetical protein
MLVELPFELGNVAREKREGLGAGDAAGNAACLGDAEAAVSCAEMPTSSRLRPMRW